MRAAPGAVFLLMFAAISARSADSVRACLPSQAFAAGWHEAGAARTFAGDELYSLIDGGADIYLEYGFKEALSARYEDTRGSSLVLEIYLMKDQSAAYGIYSNNSLGTGRKTAIGDESRIYNYYLLFWKGRYFISIVSSDTSGGKAAAAMRALAASIDKNIPGHGAKPPLLRALPDLHLQNEGYFRGFLGLAAAYRFTGEEIARPDEGVFGKYAGHRIIVLSYGDTARSAASYALASAYMRTGGRFTAFSGESGGFAVRDRMDHKVHFYRRGRFLVVVLETGAARARSVLEEVTKRLEKIGE